MLTIDSGPLTSEDQPISYDADTKKEQGIFFFFNLHPQIKLSCFSNIFSNKTS